jgi:hypothetical protein
MKTYKVWIEIEEFDSETEEGQTLDAPGASLKEFDSYEDAYKFAEGLTNGTFSIQGDSETPLTGRIEISANGIDIFFDGYEVSTMATGHGSIVFIEQDTNGNPVLYAWGDSKTEDYTDKVLLANAKDNR